MLVRNGPGTGVRPMLRVFRAIAAVRIWPARPSGLEALRGRGEGEFLPVLVHGPLEGLPDAMPVGCFPLGPERRVQVQIPDLAALEPAGPRGLLRSRAVIARLEERLKASETALVLAREISMAWQASSNEWRKENMDQRSLYATIEKAEGMFKALDIRLLAMERTQFVSTGEEKGKMNVWGIINSVLIILLTIAILIFKR